MIRLINKISEKQLEWRNDPRIMMYTRQSEILGEEDQKRWLSGLVGDKTRKMFGIELIETSKIKGMVKKPTNLGTCGLTTISYIHRTAEWSLLIAPDYQGNGYGSEALKLLLQHGFNDLGLDCIWGEIFTSNAASRRIAEKCGFKEEGKLRSRYYKNGKQIDSIMCSILRKEWDACNSITHS